MYYPEPRNLVGLPLQIDSGASLRRLANDADHNTKPRNDDHKRRGKSGDCDQIRIRWTRILIQ